MSAMSRNNSASTLMGFSVHQPTLGAALQFFPAMGSQQLDELINAYVPGSASILDKRATVSMEFFDHSLATGETFKFFMVYNTASPAMDSGYASSFTTSPTMSDSQWQPSTNASSKKVTSQKMSDFSELPGMKILTKDGLDVTNSVSRGCKTKEQRDHAHLMRIIKACDSCRRKKTKCDPSHKRTASTASSSKVTKKTSKSARPAAAPRIPVQQAPVTPALDQTTAESFSFDSLVSESFDTMDNAPMEWEQFVHFDEEPVIPYDYNFFDPASYLTPATSSSFTSPSTSPHVPITPVDQQSPEVHPGTSNQLAEVPAPNLPYLNPGGLESSTNYIDFNLYSPAASLDDDFGTGKELVAPPQPDYSDYVGRHLSEPDGDRHRQRISHSRPARGTAVAQLAANDARIESMLSSPVDIFSDFAGDAFFCQDELGYRQQSSSLGSMHDVNDYEGG
ncbi:hypothetical protein F5Y16DRAFT_206484 [Xylariaceae sp. FL0255]|nr:hypothetical protein F5Y16DRAFT_206484 [Xylariaceae sp. FL0255]